ncbi:hypothetical protein DJ568_16520 [Mucilaginibacter hurinus]|uniref:Uncharacterized protein n=1 Tax=Mucilaginibacter hurinus TaxID=2201324 RepID=A0A367GJJ3_9SPHI|nr:hypothetical protein [Mucilaginibacter hurinus]RCH53639.1 hypothetical protein DJ568_16520 [Mucilaginibacter hurinus]
MKIVPINKDIDADEFYKVLQSQLNPLFQQRRMEDIRLNIIREGNALLIVQPELYEGYLFKLIANDNALEVHESEHYVDDVNALTINGILDELFTKYLGGTTPQL